jgi:hypothetical protein
MNAVGNNATADFSEHELEKWREGVSKRRAELFRRNWKNSRPTQALKSRRQEMNFKFVIEWCEEFEEVIGRERERNRLDHLNLQAKNARPVKKLAETEDGG